MKKVHLLILVLISILPFGFTTQDPKGDRLIGVWEPSNGRSRIKIEKIGAKYFGKIVWLKEPIDPNTNKNKVDKNNPDTSMRNVPLKGYRILKDFDDFADMASVYQQFLLEKPELIIDQEGVFEELINRIPLLEDLYKKEALGIYILK